MMEGEAEELEGDVEFFP